MKKAVVFSFIVFVLLFGRALGSDKLSPIIEGIQKEYKGLPGLAIKYNREVITRTMAMLGETSKGDMAKGTIYFRPPSYLKLMQETPEAETVLVNEDTIWWYVPKKKIVYRYPSDEFGKELKLLSDIFSGLLKVEEKFRLVKLPDNKSGEHLISLYPDPPWQEVDHVVLTVTSGHEIVGVDIYNLLGGITRFRLLETMKKDLFEEGFFDFQVPEGVQVKEGKNQ